MRRQFIWKQDWGRLLAAAAQAAGPLRGSGAVADYIPALASVDAAKFGLAAVTLDGEVATYGDAQEPFSIQSISKVFSLALACKTVGPALWQRVGQLPSTNRFNSLVELELERGVPRNPFLNSGALAVADALASRHLSVEGAVVELLRRLSGNRALDYDQQVAASELAHAQRNTAAAYLMQSFGNFVNPVPEVLRAYCAICAIRASCVDLAQAGAFLVNRGICPRTGSTVLSTADAQKVCALMMTSGTYETSGRTAFRVGLPVKSGVGGGLLAVIPGFGAVCAWSPGLDESGSSAMGMAALEFLSCEAGMSIFL